jgi:hypothetical protein
MRISCVLLLASSVLAGCSVAAEEPGEEAETVTEELSTRPPSRECGAVARKAALALETINGDKSKVSRAELTDGHSDRELVRISIKRPSAWRAKKDSYLVSTESMGGSPCYVYGLSVKSSSTDLTDPGSVVGAASQECAAVARQAVLAVANVNEQRITIVGTELADGFSDHELVRVKIRSSAGANDSYVVDTESLGGSPCLVYGVQLKSEEGIDLKDR